MGKPMASRLVNAGYEVFVNNRSRSATDELVAQGAIAGESPAEIARRCDFVITMLPDGADVESVLLGDDGVMNSVEPGSLLVDMSTIAPATARHIASAGRDANVGVLDAPVSGGERGAIDGTLSIMCGGEPQDVERARAVLSVLGNRIVHVGGPGAGQTVKACNQIMVGASLQAMGEALVLGTKAGVDPEALIEALLGGAARCWALEARAPRVLERDFSPGFRCRLHHKDLGIALATGAELGVALPITASVREFLGAMGSIGRGDYDHSGLVTLVEDMSDFRVGSEQSSESALADSLEARDGL